MKAIATSAVLLLVGCLSSRLSAIDEARSNEIRRVGHRGMGKLVMPSCTTAAQPSALSAPSIQYANQDGIQIEQRCGLVAVDVLSESGIETFIRTVCNGTDGPECGSSLAAMFLARLRDRYKFADWSYIQNKCTAYPVDCQQWVNIEYWAIESHNRAVVDWTQTAFDQTNSRYQGEYERAYIEEADRRRRVGAALQAFGTAMAPKPAIHCTSHTIGATTTTNCR
ncbi:MAG TPA: hypothetical protein VFD53_09465 [Ilumatobacter sp.]|nr:hypothetical protein [Ilumatobacter sp.]